MQAEFFPGNRVTLLNSGREYFPALLAAFAAAEREIYLESYIFANDTVGSLVAQALVQASTRGVRVRVLVDGFGARNFGKDFLPRLLDAGVHAMVYRPEIGRFRFRRHRLRRLHRKLALVDGRIAFVGGINIVDDDNAPEDLRPRFDYAVRVEGPVVPSIHAALRHMWEIVVWANFKRRFRTSEPPPQQATAMGTQRAAFLRRDNFRHRTDIADAYLEAIATAREEVFIANAYFLPGFRFRHALRNAARRGVRVTILLQGVSDHPLMHYATQALYGALLADGMRVFEYRKSFLHAKVAVVDNEWATVGSSNIDPFSLLLAKEGNLFVKGKEFAFQLRESLEQAMADGAEEIGPTHLAGASFASRLLRWFSYGMVRLAVGLAGFGPKHWRADEARPGLTRPE